MPITLNDIVASDPISDAPAILNSNFTAIKQHIDDLENLLNPANNSLKLTNVLSIPANSIEASTLALTLASGNAFTVNPGGGGATLTITADGDIDGRKITVDGTGGNRSTIADLLVSGDFEITGDTELNALLDLTQPNSRVARKYSLKSIVDGSIGGAASNPVDISTDYVVYLDYHNGGAALAGDADAKLDITQLQDGQIIKLHCFRDNATGMKLYNGTTGAEVFAFIDPNNNGYTSISSSTKPEFDPQASPDNQSWLKVQWTDIGGGNFRLVVLDSKNVNGVS